MGNLHKNVFVSFGCVWEKFYGGLQDFEIIKKYFLTFYFSYAQDVGNLSTHLLYIAFARFAGSLFLRIPWQLFRYLCAHFFSPVVTCFQAFCGLSDNFRPPRFPRTKVSPAPFLNWQLSRSKNSQSFSSSHKSSPVSVIKSNWSSSSFPKSPSKQYSYNHPKAESSAIHQELLQSSASRAYRPDRSTSRRLRLVGFRGRPLSRSSGFGSGPPCFRLES